MLNLRYLIEKMQSYFTLQIQRIVIIWLSLVIIILKYWELGLRLAVLLANASKLIINVFADSPKIKFQQLNHPRCQLYMETFLWKILFVKSPVHLHFAKEKKSRTITLPVHRYHEKIMKPMKWRIERVHDEWGRILWSR